MINTCSHKHGETVVVFEGIGERCPLCLAERQIRIYEGNVSEMQDNIDELENRIEELEREKRFLKTERKKNDE
jgi:predicted Fe-Mo cluster-binding NifX family protein